MYQAQVHRPRTSFAISVLDQSTAAISQCVSSAINLAEAAALATNTSTFGAANAKSFAPRASRPRGEHRLNDSSGQLQFHSITVNYDFQYQRQ